jgi:tRNA 2-thiouridine synthesizing protein E
MQVESEGKMIELSEAGWLMELDQWTPDIGEKIAAEVEDIPELTEEHWDIINLTREMFEEHGMVAEPRKFMKEMKNRFGKDRSSNKYIFTLFPKGGLIKSANKVAGLPRPKGCS